MLKKALLLPIMLAVFLFHQSSLISAAQPQSLDTLKDKADQMIAQRLTSLNELKDKIVTIKKLTDTQKTQLTAKINTQINSLTALKTKIDADTDLDTLKSDSKSIVTSFRIFMIFEPQIHLIITADSLLTTADQTTLLADKLQAHINAAQATGKNVDNLNEELANLRNETANAKAIANQVITDVLALTPSNPDAKNTLSNARTKIKTVRENLVESIKIGKQIRQELGKFK